MNKVLETVTIPFHWKEIMKLDLQYFAENKVRYGLKNVHYAVATEDANGVLTYAVPKRYNGAVSLTLDPRGETVEFYADDRVYFAESTNDGYEGTLNTAELPIDFRIDVLGDNLDPVSKVLTENANAKGKKIALLYEFDGDVKATRRAIYNVTVSRPGESGETKTNTKTVATNELSFIAAPTVYGIVKCKTTAETPAEIYNAWYDSVFEPTRV